MYSWQELEVTSIFFIRSVSQRKTPRYMANCEYPWEHMKISARLLHHCHNIWHELEFWPVLRISNSYKSFQCHRKYDTALITYNIILQTEFYRLPYMHFVLFKWGSRVNMQKRYICKNTALHTEETEMRWRAYTEEKYETLVMFN